MAQIRAAGGGRKPKPTALKLLEGPLGHRPLPENEPQPRIAPSYPPPDSLDEDAKKIWEYLAVELAVCGLLTTIDVTKFTRYCDAWSKWKKAKELIDTKGFSYETFKAVDEPDPTNPNRILRRKLVTGFRNYPHVATYFAMNDLLAKFESEFGMSPVARTRIQVLISNPNGKNEAPDPFAFDD